MEENKKVKLLKRKTIIIIAIVVVMFLVANVYASTLGYNNIFFAINNLFNPVKEVYDPNEILSDRDITISYKSIEIADGLSVQINRLVVEDNEATLYMNIDETNAKKIPTTCLVHDMTDGIGNGKLIGNEEIDISNKGKRFDFQINLVGMNNTTSLLEIEFQDNEYATISVLQLDLKNKSINIISAEEKDLEKISEVELKEVLANYVRIHMFEDLDSVVAYTTSEYQNEQKVMIALEFLEKAGKIKDTASCSLVHSVIKEFTGEEITEPLKLSNILVRNDNENNYRYAYETRGRKALCLQISDIKYVNGVYTVKFIYCYPWEEDYQNNNIENLDKFVATMSLKINPEYKYAKYCIVDGENFVSEKYNVNDSFVDINEENNQNNSTDINNNQDNINNSTSNNSENIDNTTNNTTEINVENEELKVQVYNVLRDYISVEQKAVADTNRAVYTTVEKTSYGNTTSKVSAEGINIFNIILDEIDNNIINIMKMSTSERFAYEYQNNYNTNSSKAIQFYFQDIQKSSTVKEGEERWIRDMYVKWNIINPNEIIITWWTGNTDDTRENVKITLNKNAEELMDKIEREFSINTDIR